jgi:two-component system, NtrC family, sensor kinase
MSQAAGATQTILVIDDSEIFRDLLTGALEDAGFAVIAVETGEDGLRVAAERRPAAIVVDGVLPGIDGATVIRRIRLDSALRSTPCLLLTASEGKDQELSALDAGADAFARKREHVSIVLARLWAVLRTASSTQEDASATDSLLAPKTILLVDDDDDYLGALADALGDAGFRVVTATSGARALELLAAEPVDCILLDRSMPEMDGLETCRELKASPALRHLPVVLLTGFSEQDGVIEGLAAGADDYLSKSAGFPVLEARIWAQLRRKQFEDDSRRARDELLRREVESAEARIAHEVAEARAELIGELERKNQELESFAYSVSHDLRAPLRAIDGFSQALLEDCAEQIDERGREHLARVRAAARRMSELIDDILELSRVGRAELTRRGVDLTEMARQVVAELRRGEPERAVEVVIQERLFVLADSRLIRIVLDNLLGNAWKFTAGAAAARIELSAANQAGDLVYTIRDNGAGFDQAGVARLFRPFSRLHADSEFTGTGIGLATVHRIIDRHGGRVWGEGKVGAGAAFHFTLP